MYTVHSLVFLTLSVYYINSQAIVTNAFKNIYIYASPAAVNTLTKNVNAKTTADTQKTVLKNWSAKNFFAAGVKAKAGDRFGNKTYVNERAAAFIDSRFALKKYINFLYQKAVDTKSLTAEGAASFRKTYWTTDAKCNNSFIETMTTLQRENGGGPELNAKLVKWTGQFNQTNYKEYQSLPWRI
ncbi:unnamed protein product [Caenorhabditis auriculariae]|uniref:SXP/RAL-2 family protein Ani s 5-like cation-binding domain-containing protein n=1 Tax=Caenorhabditis auriculariae TaxID=2777116 RepID=A0A8S1HPW5_9PELO|nr:unnamed protein product [Caenorhabditis auriculariae]